MGNSIHNPFNRAFSYQAFRAFIMWRKSYGLQDLPEDSDTSVPVYNGEYKMNRAKFARRLAYDRYTTVQRKRPWAGDWGMVMIGMKKSDRPA